MNDFLIKKLRDGTRLPALMVLMAEAANEIEDLQKKYDRCRNELCLKCGNYKQSHLGACNGCVFKEDC